MPVHNGESHLREAVDSILTQTATNFELIIVDDGSQDRTATLLAEIRDKRVVVYRNSVNQGLVSSLNKALAHARGDYIARMDADDVSLPTRFERQLELFEAMPSLHVVGCQIELMDEMGRKIGMWRFPVSPGAIRWRMLFASSLAHPCVMARTSFFKRVGGYAVSRTEDYELWLRDIERARFANLGEIQLRYRQHPESLSAGEPAPYSEAAESAGVQTISRLVGYPVDVEMLRTLWAPERVGHLEFARETLMLLRDLYHWFGSLTDVTSAEREYARRHAAATAVRILKVLSRRDKTAAFAGFAGLSWLGRVHLLRSRNRQPDLLDLSGEIAAPR